VDLAEMLVTLANDLTEPLWRLLWVVAGLAGLLYFGHVLMKMHRASRFPGQHSVTLGDVVGVSVVAATMVNLSGFINATWNSMGTGTIAYGPISYSGAADFGVFADAINAVLTLASIAGGYFFFKGVLLLRRATVAGHTSHGADDVVWRAITHMLGGACLVQIADMIDRFRMTLGLVW
jgi:hypothetical protein